MPTLKQWETHFKSLSPRKLECLQGAMEELRGDKMFAQYYGEEFYCLQISIRITLDNSLLMSWRNAGGEIPSKASRQLNS